MAIKIPFIKTKQTENNSQDELENIPSHIAIIMDGNGRWAKKRNMPRVAGHRAGVKAVNRVVKAAVKYNVEVLTLYAFSTENWKRPRSEIDFLMKLPKEYLHTYLPDLLENNVRIATIGDCEALPTHTKEAVQYAVDQSKDNDGLLLNFALNYGGRTEIVHAVKQIINDFDQSKIAIDSLDEQLFSKYLHTGNVADPDLLIRTSGEKRLSNFLLWQLAYAEFWFTDVLWPDFDEEVFIQALKDYQQRRRRYGGVKEMDNQ